MIQTIQESSTLEEEHYVLGEDDDYYTNDNLYWGKVGEQCVTQAVRYAFPEWTVKHNTWGKQYEYACSKGIDITQTKPDYITVVYEVKNLADQTKPYGTDFVAKKVLPRLYGLGNVIKVLIITFLHLLTKKALALLEQENIMVIATEQRLTTQFRLGSDIHKFASKLRNLIHPNKKYPVRCYVPIPVNQSVSPKSSAVDDNRTNTTRYSSNRDEYLESLVVRPIYVEWLRYKRDVEQD